MIECDHAPQFQALYVDTVALMRGVGAQPWSPRDHAFLAAGLAFGLVQHDEEAEEDVRHEELVDVFCGLVHAFNTEAKQTLKN